MHPATRENLIFFLRRTYLIISAVFLSGDQILTYCSSTMINDSGYIFLQNINLKINKKLLVVLCCITMCYNISRCSFWEDVGSRTQQYITTWPFTYCLFNKKYHTRFFFTFKDMRCLKTSQQSFVTSRKCRYRVFIREKTCLIAGKRFLPFNM